MSTTTTTTKDTTTTTNHSDLTQRMEKLLRDNQVLKTQKERATRDNESFRTQAVAQLKTLQNNLSEKKKLIKSLRLEVTTNTTAAATNTQKNRQLRELETIRSELARKNARIRQIEDEQITIKKKHKKEKQTWQTETRTLTEDYQHMTSSHTTALEQIELYQTQQNEHVQLHHVLQKKYTSLKKNYQNVLQMKLDIETERDEMSNQLTKERVAVETERRQRHELISKAEQDAITKRQKLSRRVTKLTNDLNDKNELYIKTNDKLKNVKNKYNSVVFQVKELNIELVNIKQEKMEKEKVASQSMDAMLAKHHIHIDELRKVHDIQLQRMLENNTTTDNSSFNDSNKNEDKKNNSNQLTSTKKAVQNTTSNVDNEGTNMQTENDGEKNDVTELRLEKTVLEQKIVVLENGTETLRKIHAARIVEMTKNHKETIQEILKDSNNINHNLKYLNNSTNNDTTTTATAAATNNNNNNTTNINDLNGDGGRDKNALNIQYTINTNRLNAPSPLTMDKYEASISVRENKQNAPENNTLTTSSGTSSNSSSGTSSGSNLSNSLNSSPSSYDRQLRHKYRTTLRELSHVTKNMDRMVNERTSYISQITSMDLQMKAMQELVSLYIKYTQKFEF